MAVRPTSVSYVTAAEAPWLDEHLLAGMRAGEPTAFAQLYRERATSIYNLCLRILRSPQDAQDVTHEVFLKALRQLPGCDQDFQVKAWLYRVAVNACYDLLRARKLHPVAADAPEEIGPARIDAIEQAELAHLFEQSLARLSVGHRTVLVLKDMHGLSGEEIAAVLGVSRGATETLLFRAREAFRSAYLALVAGEPRRRCELARQAAVASVGGGLSERQRRRVTDHARLCPDCRKTVETWSLAALGLGAFLHVAPLPAALSAPPLVAAAVAGASGAGAAAGAGLAASGGATAGAGVAAGSTGVGAGTAVGATSAAAPAATAVSVGVVAKASLLVVAASALVIGGGVAVHHLASMGKPPAPPSASVSGVVAGSPPVPARKRAALARARRRAGLRRRHELVRRAEAAARARMRAGRGARVRPAPVRLPTRGPRPQPRARPSAPSR
jgi:RNA polymerase sigma factor (sigma-70 family)